MQFPPRNPIRPGDVVDVRTGPCGASRRGTVVEARTDEEPPAYQIAWADGSVTRLYVADRLVTVVDPRDRFGRGDAGALQD